ncbi:hypothetical protein HMPREF9630_00690 [Peptoanaerobacter stomatis]|uniref:Uncharacterized protein n=1 Tax=Peptoanaerobacter stomatis TaxID=796937 RepID=V9HPF1_9FIRM|nr:hypothetical protein [Peptoanaerobacter stomatis]EHL15321.1 hypothetical protein HMPREF9630_00690 [Peptoanaerobacter stomatis]
MDKNIHILNDLIDIYKKLLPHKDILDLKKSFKYNEDQVDSVLSYFKNMNPSDTKTASQNKKKSNLPELNSRKDVEEYYLKNMIHDKSDKKSKQKIIDNYYLEDLRKLYFLIFSSNSKDKKIIILEKLEQYFENISRAKNL